MKRLFTLALDTSLNACSIAVVRNSDEACLFSSHESMPRGQAEQLIPLIEKGLENSGITYTDIGHIVCTRGPGAFTGIRIGLATARALCLSLNIAGTGISTLEAVATTFRLQHVPEEPFLVCLESKRTDFYTQLFSQDGTALGEPSCLHSPHIRALCQKRKVNYICGDGTIRLQAEHANQQVERPTTFYPMAHTDCCILAGIGLGKQRMLNKKAYNLHPLYLRNADIGCQNKLNT